MQDLPNLNIELYRIIIHIRLWCCLIFYVFFISLSDVLIDLCDVPLSNIHSRTSDKVKGLFNAFSSIQCSFVCYSIL